MSGLKDYVIEKGVLKKYVGSGGDVVIPDGVKTVGEGAFGYCYELKSVIIPEGVVQICAYAFIDCEELVSVSIPASATRIHNEAFDSNNLKSITVAAGNPEYHSEGNCLIKTHSRALVLGCKNSEIPTDGSVTSIGKNAFTNCTKLKKLSIPESITSLSAEAFSGSYNIEKITVSKKNPEYHSKNNCLIETHSKTLILGCKNSVIPDDGSVTEIGDYAFGNCEELADMRIPQGITRIGDGAFFFCGGIKTLEIPDSISSIGHSAFFFCSNLTHVTIPDKVMSIGQMAFSGCQKLTLHARAGSYAEQYAKENKLLFSALVIRK